MEALQRAMEERSCAMAALSCARSPMARSCRLSFGGRAPMEALLCPAEFFMS